MYYMFCPARCCRKIQIQQTWINGWSSKLNLVVSKICYFLFHIFRIIHENPSHWRTHIFQGGTWWLIPLRKWVTTPVISSSPPSRAQPPTRNLFWLWRSVDPRFRGVTAHGPGILGESPAVVPCWVALLFVAPVFATWFWDGEIWWNLEVSEKSWGYPCSSSIYRWIFSKKKQSSDQQGIPNLQHNQKLWQA